MVEIYHVLSRGVDKRKIFMDDKDYLRFIHDLFEFNNQLPVSNILYRFGKNKNMDIVSPYIKKPRELLVDISAFCLMPNHYHLLLEPRAENGISLFMKKLNIGYAKYFNKKYERTGALFEGRYKSILIKNHAHFTHIPYYIHLNPLDIIAPEWRERKIKDYKKTIQFLDSYRWSSHLDYTGKKNFPSVTRREFLLDCFHGEKGYKKSIEGWLKDLDLENKNLSKEFVLE